MRERERERERDRERQRETERDRERQRERERENKELGRGKGPLVFELFVLHTCQQVQGKGCRNLCNPEKREIGEDQK
jgi:hypothetical protein